MNMALHKPVLSIKSKQTDVDLPLMEILPK